MAQVAGETANPMGLKGVDFVEYAGPDSVYFEKLFVAYGFKRVGEIAGKKISLYRQGHINFVINSEPGSFALQFAKAHGPAICSTGFKVKNAKAAYDLAVKRGGKPFKPSGVDSAWAPEWAIYGIGDSIVYFMDESASKKFDNEIFKVKPEDAAPRGLGFTIVDHFTNNVPKGEMQKWCDFYTKVFNFRETMYFDIKGKSTGLISKVMRSPCGLFAVPINEPTDGKSQIQEYLDEYKGSGIQHVALLTDDITKTLMALRENKLDFLPSPPGTYYRQLKDRLPAVSEDISTLEKNSILVDGDHDGYLLQIFSKNIIGPIFFEVIQRKGHDGFGNGNFQALFDAIEADQRERGYLT
ncbi:MAG: 4-hydroxyphenylpyruvate dioxygenase [Bdellovibrio sp.]|jgi:4-hydroxyphenylpyruvate dioxygenase